MGPGRINRIGPHSISTMKSSRERENVTIDLNQIIFSKLCKAFLLRTNE